MRATNTATAVAIAAVALVVSGCGGSHHQAGHPVKRVSPPTRADVVHSFAEAYLKYIDGQLNASKLPDVTAAARAAVIAGGQIPASHRRGRVVLVGTKTAQGVRGGVLITARNSAGTLYAQETVSHTAKGWQVTNVLTPDYVQVFAKQTTATVRQPAGSAPAEAAARTFLSGYLRWYYGHAPVSAIKSDTPALTKQLAAHPPNIPPTMTSLQGQAKSIGMQRHGSGWQALVNVHDSDSTYQLTLSVQKLAGRWTVTGVTSQ